MAKYYQATGRRKTATAQVRLVKGKGLIVINKQENIKYFSDLFDAKAKLDLPLRTAELLNKFDISIITSGGGKKAQLDASQLAIARALVIFKPGLKGELKANGLLTRDPRMKERKKPGLKRARRAAQWKKR